MDACNVSKRVGKDVMLPNFLIIGALKAGTTSLYQYLKSHPQVFMSSIKEPSFFAYEGRKVPDTLWGKTVVVQHFSDYVALFEGAVGKTAIGEASPMYLVNPQAPERIKHYIPEIKLIAILRNPVDRAYSQWQMEIRNGTEKIDDFAKAIQCRQTMPDGTVRQRYVYGGKYYSLLKGYYDLFDPSQICVLLYDNLLSDAKGFVQTVCHFLNIDPTYVPPNLYKRYNEGNGLPRDRFSLFFFQKLYPRIAQRMNLLPAQIRKQVVVNTRILKRHLLIKPPELSPERREELKDLFTEDLFLLQDLIQQDLSIWL